MGSEGKYLKLIKKKKNGGKENKRRFEYIGNIERKNIGNLLIKKMRETDGKKQK